MGCAGGDVRCCGGGEFEGFEVDGNDVSDKEEREGRENKRGDEIRRFVHKLRVGVSVVLYK